MRTIPHHQPDAMSSQKSPSVSPQVCSSIACVIDALGLELSTSANPLRKLIGLILHRHAYAVATMLVERVQKYQPEAAAELLKEYENGPSF